MQEEPLIKKGFGGRKQNCRKHQQRDTKRHAYGVSRNSENIVDKIFINSYSIDPIFFGTDDKGYFKIPESSFSAEEAEDFYNKNKIVMTGDNTPRPYASFSEMKLPEEMLKLITENNWLSPTPIQSSAIPVALQGKDLIGIAKTGSGKTGAFLIPGIIHLSRSTLKDPKGPLVLVLSPTRELAQQINDVSNQICNISHQCVFGGSSREYQIRKLTKHPRIVIGTPGRIIDFIDANVLDLSFVNFLVIDEADRMLDMGFEPQLRRIISSIPKTRQTMMFSATWPKEIRQLAADFLKDPTQMVVGSQALTANANIRQIVERVGEGEKLGRAIEILKRGEVKKAIVFVNTKRTADALAEKLKHSGISTVALHGDMAQNKRDFTLARFRCSSEAVLVATDVAARGIDVSDIDTVLNYDFPCNIEDYVHRIGRTARGERDGTAITLFADEDRGIAKKLVKVLASCSQDVPEWLAAAAEEASEMSKQSKVEQYNSRASCGYGSEENYNFESNLPFPPLLAGGGRSYGTFGGGYGGPRCTFFNM